MIQPMSTMFYVIPKNENKNDNQIEIIKPILNRNLQLMIINNPLTHSSKPNLIQK